MSWLPVVLHERRYGGFTLQATAKSPTNSFSSELSENSQTLLKQRYISNGETIDNLWDRASGGNPRYRRLMSELLFLPNSPTLFNAGLNNGCTLSACFVFNISDCMIGDNWELRHDSILGTRIKAAAVAKAGGGVGYYGGNLRPKGSLIKTVQRVACGSVAVLKDMNALSALITQGGKRALAQMFVLPCWHGDIKDFIHCKDVDPQSLSSFNISVAWHNSWVEKVGKDVRETDLWDEQCQSAWKQGCPGMFFPDTVNACNPNPHLGLMQASNPCFTGDTKVWTIEGPKRFDELVGKEIPVLSQDSGGNLVFKMMRNISKTREDERVYRVVTRAYRGKQGNVYGEFTATQDHIVFLRNGGQRRVGDLRGGDRLASVYRRKANRSYLTLANTAGDSDMEHRVVVSYKHGCRPEYPTFHVHHKDGNKRNNLPDNLEVIPGEEHNAMKMLGDKNPMVRFPEKNVFNDPEFREKYGDGGGFSGHIHSRESKQRISDRLRQRKKNHEVVGTKYVGKQDVYDGTVDDTHCFFIYTEEDGGVLVHNCGETPNRTDEPCNLGSHALPRYFNQQTRDIDWNKLEDGVRDSIWFLDDILDRNTFPHPEITKASLLTRKLGMGVMGWADLLAMMHIHYDSDEALALGDKLMSFMNQVAMDTSIDIAKVKGPYDGYSVDKTNGPCARNETRTSIAPTGTIYLIAGCNSSGIEPHYSLEHTRKTGDGMVLTEKVDCDKLYEGFVPHIADDIHWSWHVRHQATFQKHTDLGVSKTINLPNSATVKDVSDSYRMMHELGCKGGTIFRDKCREGGEQVLTKKEDPKMISRGRNQGENSFGALREGSKSLSREEVAKELSKGNNTPISFVHRPMPQERNSKTVKFTVGGTEMFLTVGLWEDSQQVGEIFLNGNFGTTIAGLLNAFCITFSLSLQYGTPLRTLIKHHINTRFEPNGITDNQDVRICTSIPDLVCRWLAAKYLKEEEKRSIEQIDSGIFCPECSSQALYQSGCLVCSNTACGWSRCG